jgi:hypothetical protein
MTDAPYGLQAIRNKAAGNTLRTKLYRVTASGNTQGIFINDPVRFNSAGLGVIRLSSNAAANTRCLGVVSELFDENGRPLTFSQPGRGPFLPASTAGWAAVYDSQQVTFMCQADNTAAGTSVMQIRAASGDTSIKTFQVLGLAPTEARGLGTVANNAAWGNAYIDLEVRIALHSYTS